MQPDTPSQTGQPAPSVLVFDSGVGGLSVAGEIRKLLPGLRLIYAADYAFLPYGEKTEAQLIERVPRLLAALEARFAPKIVVIACNTASTVVLPATRAALQAEVVGTVPAIKPAAALTQTKVIGLLGTPGTVRRTYTQHLIDDFASDCQVLRHGSVELVGLAEAKLRGEKPSQAAVEAAIAPLYAQPGGGDVDVVVLACTHFPLLAEELAAASAPKVRLIDSGAAIARRVKTLLGVQSLPGPAPAGPAILTPGADIGALKPAFAAYGFDEIEILDV
ncbi:MAG: glutamate racemase [Caulobacterales bacterium]